MSENRSRVKPWYNCTTKETILQDADARYYPRGILVNAEIIDILTASGCKLYRTASHNGYIPASDLAILPYCGRYGAGYIIVKHKSAFRVEYYYFIKKEGSEDGEDSNTTPDNAKRCP